MAECVVGSRCCSDGYYGTVRFIGAVPPSSGEWIGVEWDDPTRGRHDGSKDGVKYFHCSKPSNCGSFMKRRKLEFGITYKQAIEKKYDRHQKVEDIVVGEYENSQGKKVEMFGFDKQAELLSHHNILEVVDLLDNMISSAGPDGEVASITPSAKILNLSLNPLISSWKVIADIVCQLPQLYKLILNQNKLEVSASLNRQSKAFDGISTLCINTMGMEWNELQFVLKEMPNLVELYASENHISSLGGSHDSGENNFPLSLRVLDVGNNCLTDWKDVLRLQHLPNLTTLVLTGNKLSLINGLTKASFPSLMLLSLKNNNIQNWAELNDINKLQSLKNFNFSNNPIHKEDDPFNNRLLSIARLPSVQALNNSEISNKERLDAERYYVKKHAREWLLAEKAGTTESFLSCHPHYITYVNTHGLPTETTQPEIAGSVSALGSRLIEVTLLCPDKPDIRTLKKKLPDSMTILKVKGLLQRVYKINVSDQLLSYCSHKMVDSKEIEMNDDLKQLSFYSLETGDQILVRIAQ